MIPPDPARSAGERPAWDRPAHLRALTDRVFDLAVIGGGATGCSVARDAALRGLDVCLVERADLAWGTSSRSTRFIHGGLRYLRNYEFGFVREGLEERAILTATAPHLVRASPFLFPSYRGVGPHRWLLRTGIALYDLLARGRRLAPSTLLDAEEALRREPGLRREGLTGAVVYGDATTDDARLVVESAVGAVEAGAIVALHAEVERILPSDGGPTILVLRDRIADAPLGTRAAVVVNATGAWLGGIPLGGEATGVAPARGVQIPTRLRRSRGSHLVVAREDLPVSHVVVMPSRTDRRLLFAVPAGAFTYLGTTEVLHEGNPDEVRAAPEEVDYILSVAAATFDGGPIPRERVRCTWSGLRPLIEREGLPTGMLSRDFRIAHQAPGLIAVAGGKLTTCRRMAEATVDLAVQVLRSRYGRSADPCITRWKLFPGAEGSAVSAVEAPPVGIDPEVARHLSATYGTRAGRIFAAIRRDPAAGAPFAPGCAATPAEVTHAAHNEGAVRLADLLFRRLHPHLLEARLETEAGRAILEGASRAMAAALGWDERRRGEELLLAKTEWRRDFAPPQPVAPE